MTASLLGLSAAGAVLKPEKPTACGTAETESEAWAIAAGVSEELRKSLAGIGFTSFVSVNLWNDLSNSLYHRYLKRKYDSNMCPQHRRCLYEPFCIFDIYALDIVLLVDALFRFAFV